MLESETLFVAVSMITFAPVVTLPDVVIIDVLPLLSITIAVFDVGFTAITVAVLVSLCVSVIGVTLPIPRSEVKSTSTILL